MIRNVIFACALVTLTACDGGGSDVQLTDSAKALLDKQASTAR